MSNSLNILPLEEWMDVSPHPLVISGPCSAESKQQMLQTAHELANNPYVKIFRAGIWKPRTRPGSFEGAGIEGLKWLQAVKQETGLKVSTEVATPQHIEAAVKHGVDILWIGARTVVSPFSMQEIAEALKGIDIPIMVKNPLNPDVKLWIGALERINQVGINKLMAIHRGFDYFRKTPFRNAPMWEIPIELKRLIPNLPIIVDPSHICGKRELLFDISQKAFDLNMDGLMIESHIHPEQAITDAAQQITPAELMEMMDSLIIRSSKGTIEFEHHLEELRSEIDKIDAQLIQMLGHRMRVVEEIGNYKKQNNITILQLKRWGNLIKNRMELGETLNLDKDFLLKILELLHKQSIQVQTDIMSGNEKKKD
ncbi:MAG: bifunctional 3-deoxy-7-phosphoheptulonate synthase/chorismate mutase type II [Bacteroidales bacterium]|nr:bifunctional 3-deoxy-7-phosphoheptulonate synthase/chorismate mutase type II [Bacteroidales bacterium]